MTDLDQSFLNERKRFNAIAGGGVALPVAGAIYWGALAALGFYLEPKYWAIAAAAGSGLIFPLGLLLQGPFRSPFWSAQSPLKGAVRSGIMAINLIWPVHILLIFGYPDAVPLSLAIGMGLHWPIVGWAYASRVSLIHAFLRVGAVSVIWYAMPEMRFTGLPVAVTLLYIFSAIGLSWEARRFRSQLDL